MAIYMVDRDLPGVTMEQLGAAQKAAIETGQKIYGRRKERTLHSHDVCVRRSPLHVPV